MHNIYKVGGHCFKVSGSILCSVLERMAGFAPFEVAEGDDNVPEFFFMEGKSGNIPAFCERQYVFAHEGVEGIFGCTAGGYLLRLSPVNEKSLFLWTDNEVNVCYLCGNWSARLVRFALWIGYGIQTAMSDTVAIHSSCIVYRQKAVLFLGESGTGKSTHTRLWQEYRAGAVLLNDKGRKIFLTDWQNRKKDIIKHPFLDEKIPWGLVPFVQAQLLGKVLRGDLDVYPSFLWK